MSEEMAVSDNTTGDEAKVTNDEATTAAVPELEAEAEEAVTEPTAPVAEEPPALAEEEPVPDPAPDPDTEELKPKIEEADESTDVKKEPDCEDSDIPIDPPEYDVDIKNEDEVFVKDEIETFEHNIEEHLSRGIKRRASSTFSDDGDEEFKGFDDVKVEIKTEGYLSVLERLEEEPAFKIEVEIKRKKASAASSPAQRGGRRATTEMSSPLLRVPLERGWKRELVFRAALDAHSRRNADIYYYTPAGKKLRSTREVAEHLAGTGLTVENFSFFKEPLGVDDPEKEIIRDAKMIRRVESPVAAPAPLEGKRTPKPKPPKGASPEPATPAQQAKSPPAKLKKQTAELKISISNAMMDKIDDKIKPVLDDNEELKTRIEELEKEIDFLKRENNQNNMIIFGLKEQAENTSRLIQEVKSMGSRLSTNAAPAPAASTPPPKQQKKPQQQQQATTPSNTDNNNSAAWKKPRKTLIIDLEDQSSKFC
ncbi:hypothetical protein B5X24_HaOG206872 [Helicoverpa armigera]|uniref:MBD domain-containing protein n=1 Tax=Helicoverpa armigera TaxID=29058 RepID=A0A2W1BQF7_HELAM|nr:hypothetical protein B5X24_HaOG206872 [Helicoverpa armigera]